MVWVEEVTPSERAKVEAWMWEPCPHGHIGTNHCADCIFAFAAEAVQAVDQAWRTAAWTVHQPPTLPEEIRPCPLCDLMLRDRPPVKNSEAYPKPATIVGRRERDPLSFED